LTFFYPDFEDETEQIVRTNPKTIFFAYLHIPLFLALVTEVKRYIFLFLPRLWYLFFYHVQHVQEQVAAIFDFCHACDKALWGNKSLPVTEIKFILHCLV